MRIKGSDLAKTTLSIIGAVGIVVIALTIPNALGAFGKLYYSGRKYDKRQFKQSLNYLKSRKLVTIAQEGGKTVIELTKNGKAKLLKYKLNDIVIQPQKKWDRKWRLVCFDIPEKLKASRVLFQRKLREIGLIQIQKSLYITPYPCEDEIDFIKEMFEIRPFVRIVTAESIDIDHDLKVKFSLA